MSDEMIKCSACGKEYHNKADKCPNCGKKNPQETPRQVKYTIFVLALAGVIVLAFLMWVKSQF
jgi:uncharacterized protein (DUF983 family)